jgi:solute carrier family 66 (lysosomal lysine-arginine transporter), member 1
MIVQYTICDSILLIQIYFYRWKRRRLSCGEREPLLLRNAQETISATLLLVRYTGALLFVIVVGVVAWWIGETQQIDPTPPPSSRLEVHILGWTSAIFYVCGFLLSRELRLMMLQLVARIPQICPCLSELVYVISC